MPNDLWYKDAIIYELHVRAFHDSSGDGIGDFRGLKNKLDYLQDLGVTALWLLPFYPSPLKDDGYDIAYYSRIHPAYGTLRDFKDFLREAHRRDLKVITELVINHTSDQHPWFQRARRSKAGSKWRNFYVWSDTPDQYKETRIIFKDFESSNWSWDPAAKAYYWHRFYSHQPDLNFDNPAVQQSVLRIMNFWLQLGVDGMRLDAIPYLFERENTTCENLPETHAFLRKMRAHFDKTFENRMLLGEANQWPEDAVAYFGKGDECHMCFHFPLMPRLFMAIRTEDRFPIIDILEQTPEIPEICQWALFLRNHDELTLEMVTDEERDYMYRVYATDPQARINLGIRRRLAPLLGNNRRKIELMTVLLFSLPGTPVIYYGDEIGMGDNIYLGDRNSVRTPMQWSADQNAGYSKANPQRLYLPVIIDPEYHHHAINVEAQSNNPHSLLWWMKRMIALRKRFKAFSRGTLKFLYPENRKVLAFVRQDQDQSILVVVNLSRFAQYAELDLSEFRGMVPVEIFSRNGFPPVGELPYLITLGPHSFYWFVLEHRRFEEPVRVVPEPAAWPAITVAGKFEEIFRDKTRAALEEILSDYIRDRRWFGGKARAVRAAKIIEVLPVEAESEMGHIILIRLEYVEGDPDTYLLPVAFADATEADQIREGYPHAVIACLEINSRGGKLEGVLYDALFNRVFCRTLLRDIASRRRIKGTLGELASAPTRALERIKAEAQKFEPSILRSEQSNTSVIYGDQLILKVFRRLEEGKHPDLEIGRFLTERGFPNIPQVAGFIEYRRKGTEDTIVGILQQFVQNEGVAWQYTLDSLSRYLERIISHQDRLHQFAPPQGTLLQLARQDLPTSAFEAIGVYLESARLLGQRTAEMHLALSSDAKDPDFAPEPFSALAQRSYYQSLRSLTNQVLQLLRKKQRDLASGIQEDAARILDSRDQIIGVFKSMLERKLTAMRMRCHGDYHLGQVLYTGRDFVIIDFEGEPARPLSERRIKRSALRDVAGMLRSFHYVSHSALLAHRLGGWIGADALPVLEQWAHVWHTWVSVGYLKSYLETARGALFLPATEEELQVLLNVHALEKAVYELGYELNNRPDWVKIPIRGILELLHSRV